MAITGGCSKIVQDVPPFMMVDGNPARVRHINQVGLERAGSRPGNGPCDQGRLPRFSTAADLNTAQALERLRAELGDGPEVRRLIEFVGTSKRGITR